MMIETGLPAAPPRAPSCAPSRLRRPAPGPLIGSAPRDIGAAPRPVAAPPAAARAGWYAGPVTERAAGQGSGADPVIRVVLADDERMLRAGIRAILSADPGIEVVGEAADGAQAVEQVRRHRPDIALVDVQMPGTDGLAATEAITAEFPETAVVILTTFGEDAYIARALGGGARGFVLKTGDPHDLIAGLRGVAEGGAYLSPEVARRIIAELRGTGTEGRMSRGAAARERIGPLSAREREVLALVGEGLSNGAIADRLGIAPGTVKVHIGSILTRLDLANREQAAVAAHGAGLVARDPFPPARGVLAVAGEARTTGAIAARLGIAPGPVKVHIGSIPTRLDPANRVQAAVLAYEAGLVAGDPCPPAGGSGPDGARGPSRPQAAC